MLYCSWAFLSHSLSPPPSPLLCHSSCPAPPLSHSSPRHSPFSFFFSVAMVIDRWSDRGRHQVRKKLTSSSCLNSSSPPLLFSSPLFWGSKVFYVNFETSHSAQPFTPCVFWHWVSPCTLLMCDAFTSPCLSFSSQLLRQTMRKTGPWKLVSKLCWQ